MTLQEVKTEILKLGKIIFVSDDKYPDFGSSSQNGNPHLEVDSYGNFYFIVAEKNEEFERRTTKDFQEFLFWVFENITFSMACDYELNNKKENQDYRILIFQKQDELLEKLDNSWAKNTRKKHEKLLLPNEETKLNRKAYCNKLESQGIDILTAWTKACEKYPTIKKNNS